MGFGSPVCRLEAPSLPPWLPAPPLWLPAPPLRPPAPWTRTMGLHAIPLPQVAPGGRRKRGDAGCTAPMGRLLRTPPPVGPRRLAHRSTRGLLVGPRRPAPRPRARRGASVLRHHHHRDHRHHSHHHRWVCRRHHHLGVISPRGTSSSNNNNSSSSRPASKVAGRSRAPSECSPFFH
jgi:hypothetical protein